MIIRQIRSTAVAALLVAAGIWLWIGLAPTAPPGPVPDEQRMPLSTDPKVALDTQEPSDDLNQALTTARTFAVALYRDDVAALHELVTPALAETLLAPTGLEQEPSGQVQVEGTITRDVLPGRVLVDVIVRRGPVNDQRLETVTASLVRSGGRWVIDDVAF